MRQMLDKSCFRERARQLSGEIVAAGGAERAADLIEALLGEPRASATTADAAPGDVRDDSRSESSSTAIRAS